MSTDRFISGVQLPNVDQAVTVRASDSSDYRRTYYKSGDLYYTDEAGTESKLTGRIATTTTLGEVSVDGTTITVDAAGTISAVGDGGINNIIEDTTPQLGGNLDLNSFDIDGIGNISITGNASIVGNINVTSTINMISPDTNHNISIEMLDTDTVSFSGDSGELFSVTDSMIGTIYSVNDISGVPSIEVDDDGTIRFAEITGNVLVGTNVDDGIHKLQVSGDVSANSIQLTGGTGSDGTISWNTDEGTLDLIEGNTTLQIGQEVLYNVKNQTGSTIPDGTPVMAAGTLGNSGRILIAPMDATNSVNAKFYLGVTTETITDGADGKVTHFGKVRGIDLSAYQEGDVLWLSTDTVGAFTTTEPTVGIKIPTAFVISNSSNGTMMVRATNSMGLVDLDDVFKETLDAGKDGQVLTWNNTNSRFEVSAITESQISDLQTYLTAVPAEYLTQTEGDARYLINTLQSVDLKDGSNNTIVTLSATGNTTDSVLTVSNYQDSVFSNAFSVDATGQLTASSFSGDGSNITNINYSVTSNDVTQHETALSITESQISDLQSYLTDAPSDGNQYARQNGVWSIVDAGGGTFLPVKVDDITTVNGQSTYNLTLSGSPYTPSIAVAMLVSVNGVIQEPNTAFTVSGSQISFTSSLATNDVVDFIIDLGNAIDVEVPNEINDLTAAVTWANVPDANITESSVTQHQAALSITESQISDLQSYLTAIPTEYLTQTEGDSRYLQSYTETDPVFSASASAGITSTNISNWNTAYGWGDHSVQGYLTSYTETDTLNDVTGRGSTTTNGITVGSIDVNGQITELTRNATITGTQALNATLGTLQRLVLSGNVTFTDSVNEGEFITLMIDDGTGNTITWPTISWITGVAPSLDTTNLTTIQIWKLNNVLYGALVGVAS